MTDSNEAIGTDILKGEDIHLSFDGVKALDGLDFSVRAGRIISVIGPNGAGKTCLINCITGYYRPQQGRITFNGRGILHKRPHQIARLGISRTFQDPTTYPSMTALDILMAGRYIHTRTTVLDSMLFFGRSRREELESRQVVEEIIQFVQIEELRKIPVAAMSFGQRKQVEIARALVMQPTLIILDEPMSGLDEVMKEIITELILNMYDRGMTIVLIEHDAQVVMEISHSIIVLDHGQRLAEGTPREISLNERVAEAYLGLQV
jgi:branched-chain amino acid transport system ATP-binding protein